jgi:prepilin-type processing-associated H-X9-DG protein
MNQLLPLPLMTADPCPLQLGGWALKVALTAGSEPAVVGNAAFADEDVDLSQQSPGNGNAGGNTIYRLREGIERFLITDINNPAASAKAQSDIFIMFDAVATKPSAYNHIPGGANILYMDGHVAFMRYEKNGPQPINGGLAALVGALSTDAS